MMAPVANGDRRCRYRHKLLLVNTRACVAQLSEFRRFLLEDYLSDETRSIIEDSLFETEERLLRFARLYGFALGPVRPGTEVDRS